MSRRIPISNRAACVSPARAVRLQIRIRERFRFCRPNSRFGPAGSLQPCVRSAGGGEVIDPFHALFHTVVFWECRESRTSGESIAVDEPLGGGGILPGKVSPGMKLKRRSDRCCACRCREKPPRFHYTLAFWRYFPKTLMLIGRRC